MIDLVIDQDRRDLGGSEVGRAGRIKLPYLDDREYMR